MQNIKFKIKKLLKAKSYKLEADTKGFIALITILIILGVVLLIGLGVAQLSFGEIQMGLQKSQSSQAYYLTNLCAEEALMRLKTTDGAYSGPDTINIENDSCQIEQIIKNSKWIIKVSGTASNQIKKMKIVVSQINPEMIIDSWQEVAEF